MREDKGRMASDASVLVIRLSSLGDIVMATAALAPLRRAGYSVSFVTKKEFAPVLQGHPDITEVFAYDKSQGEAAARAALFAWIEARSFHFVLDLQDSWRTWTWRRKLRALFPVHVARKPRLREWLVLWLRLGRWFGLGRGGRARRFRDAAALAVGADGAQGADQGPLTQLHVSREEQEKVRSLLPEGKFAVVLPASAWKGKEWPHFPELAGNLARGMPVVALGAAKDSTCDVVAEAAARINPASRSLRGRTSLRESMAVLAQASWVVGNDTGMAHVAEALGRDVAVIEGPTHPELGFSPYREGSVALGLPLVCRPCSKSGRICPRWGSRLCLNGLNAASVAEVLRQRGFPC